MGCGCKNTSINEVVEIGPITFKLILKKMGLTLAMLLLLIILTPFIVILIWYYGIRNGFGGKNNTLNILLKYIKNKKEKIEEVDEIVDDDEYELINVDVIK